MVHHRGEITHRLRYLCDSPLVSSAHSLFLISRFLPRSFLIGGFSSMIGPLAWSACHFCAHALCSLGRTRVLKTGAGAAQRGTPLVTSFALSRKGRRNKAAPRQWWIPTGKASSRWGHRGLGPTEAKGLILTRVQVTFEDRVVSYTSQEIEHIHGGGGIVGGGGGPAPICTWCDAHLTRWCVQAAGRQTFTSTIGLTPR